MAKAYSFIRKEIERQQKAGRPAGEIVHSISNDMINEVLELQCGLADSEEDAQAHYDTIIDNLLEHRTYAKELWHKWNDGWDEEEE